MTRPAETLGADDTTEALARQRLVPVLRSTDVDDAIATARACAAEGLTVVELTTTTHGVTRAISTLAAEGLTVGLGTVRTAGEVDRAVAAGAAFVVSYANPPGFVAAALGHGVLPIPGAFTVSEIQRAHDDGAIVVKVFPAAQSSPHLVADIAPLIPAVRLMATGGLDTASLRAWLDAGAVAVGVGSAISTVAAVGTQEVRLRVRRLGAAVGTDPTGSPASPGRPGA